MEIKVQGEEAESTLKLFLTESPNPQMILLVLDLDRANIITGQHEGEVRISLPGTGEGQGPCEDAKKTSDFLPNPFYT